MQTEKRYVTIHTAAAVMGLPEHRVRAWAKTGAAPGFKSGTRFYIDVLRLQQKLDEGRMDGEQ